MMDVLARITYFREKKGWSEYQLSEKSTIPQSTINSWSRKNFIPSITSLEKICDAFGITLSQFFSEDDSFSLTQTQKNLILATEHLEEDQLLKLIEFIEVL